MGDFTSKIAQEVREALLDDIYRANFMTHGEVFWLFEDSDQGYAKMVQDHPKNVFTSLTTVYNAVTSNRNDLILAGAHTSHTLAAGLVWSKSRIHLIGMDGGDRLVQQGTKIKSTVGAADAYVLKVTGTRNVFKNLKIIQDDTNGAALHVVEMGGEGTVWKNCSFIFGVEDNLDQTNAYEVVCGEDSGTFINCTFGSDVLDTSVARAVMAIDIVTASQEMKSCIFKDCYWNILSDDANANFIRILATTDLKFGSTFINAVMHASINSTTGGVVLTDAVDSVASLVEGSMLFTNPQTNCPSFCGSLSAKVYVAGSGVATQAAFIGIGVTPT